MSYKFLILTIILGIFLIQFSSASHYILGTVENAKDGKNANEFVITLWNPLNVLEDNLTDMIGINGNSGESNNYSIDCELLTGGCNLGEILSLKIFNNGSDYVSEIKNVTVTGSGFDLVENITLNSPPTSSPTYPINNQNSSSSEIEFNCSINDLDSNIANVTLYGNWSGGWHANETKAVNGGENYVIFNKTLSEGVYIYGCKVTDNLSISNFSQENNSFTIDLTKPVIISIMANESSFCSASKTIRVNCTTTDEILGVNRVILQAIAPGYTINYTGNFLSGNTYYSDIIVNQTGHWNFNCIVNDSAGNENNLTNELFILYSSSPELYINYQTIFLNNSNPIENQTITINASIENLGCANANNVIIGYFLGNPDLGGINIANETINVNPSAIQESKISWNALIGKNNIFVLADFGNSFSEDNETNNKANKTFSMNSWQNIYGNVTINKLIGSNLFNLTSWLNESNLTGNIFITDSECIVNWLTLQAISKKVNGVNSLNDFSEIDSKLAISNFEDSISNEFSNSQTPKQTQNFLVHQNEILSVPIINSSSNYNFMTGILWDYSDDSGNSEYDASDGEDIIFVGKINKNSQGNYGFYDYEVKIPAKLREYKTDDYSEIYFYYDLN